MAEGHFDEAAGEYVFNLSAFDWSEEDEGPSKPSPTASSTLLPSPTASSIVPQVPQQQNDFDHFIIDVEGISFGVGGSNSYKISYTVFQEAALIRASIKDGVFVREIVYHHRICYDIKKTIEELSELYRGKYWSTVRFASQCNGCRLKSEGTPASKAIDDINAIIAKYPGTKLWAKGPALERRFLAGLASVPVVMHGRVLPDVNDLATVGCPRFDDMSKVVRDQAWRFVSAEHREEFHPFSESAHCCAVECMAAASWMFDNRRSLL
jgi:hypothetical protein